MFCRGLIDILMERPISLHELALLLDERPRDLEDDLQHLFRSLRKDPLGPVVTPAHLPQVRLPVRGAQVAQAGEVPMLQGDLDQRAADLPGGETMSEPSEKDAGTEDSPLLRIECYAGHRADTEPRRLHIGQFRLAAEGPLY
jgi:hypothetical protein